MISLKANTAHLISFKLNGTDCSGHAESRMLLSDFLRHVVGATGTHVGCEHGVCGACTVQLDGEPIRACLALAVQVEGRAVTTVEGLASKDGELSELQKCFRKHHALQCGFCTAGILMSLEAHLREQSETNESNVRDVLSGHICRCTGYTPIVDAAMEAVNVIRAINLVTGES